MPTPEERLATKQHRFVLSVSKHQGNQCNWCPRSEEAPPAALFYDLSKNQDDQALGAHAQGERVPRDSATPIWGVPTPRRLALH